MATQENRRYPRHVSLLEAQQAQRFMAETMRAFESKLRGDDGKLRVERDDVLAIAKLAAQLERAWIRARTLRGKPPIHKAPVRDHSPAGRAQRAAARKAQAQAQPGSIAPIGPSAPAPVPTPSTQSDSPTPAPSDDAKESISSA